MNTYIVINGKDYDHPFEIKANFMVIDNKETKHLLFYVEDPSDNPKGYIIALNYYTWTIIGKNGKIVMNPFKYIVT